MSDQKDEAPTNSPYRSTHLPIKKRDFTVPIPNYSIDNDDLMFGPVNMKHKLKSLQDKAYFCVLRAFMAECPAISSTRIMILKDLTKELNIDYKTHILFEDAIKADPFIQSLRNDLRVSEEKEMEKLAAAKELKITGVDGQPLTIRTKPKIPDTVLAPARIEDGKVKLPAKIRDEDAQPSSTCDDSPFPNWGQVSPGSLVGGCVHIRIRMLGGFENIKFLIKEYDAKTETHQLVSAFSKKDSKDPCSWMDLRYIPVEDIIWPEGHPGFPVWNRSPKPGETLVHKSSTARNKKQLLQEVHKTSCGIPIIRKLDK